MRSVRTFIALCALAVLGDAAYADSYFTVPESILLGSEYSSVSWHDDGTAQVTRTDLPGNAVQFAFTGLTGSGAIMKDDYPVGDYGQILPSHGSGDFTNFQGYQLWIENTGSQEVTVSLFINTGFTGPSGIPSNDWHNDTFWQSTWQTLPPGQARVLKLEFDNAIPWNIEDNPDPHTQGTNGVATSINDFDRAEVSAIGYQITGAGAGTILIRPTQFAGTFYVDDDAPNDPGTGTQEDPFRRIQDAINIAQDSHIIEIQKGTYTGTGNTDLDPLGLSITIRSTNPNDPNTIADTLIQPNGSETTPYRAFWIHQQEDPNCVIEGLMIKDAYSDAMGGAIFCHDADPTIRNCWIVNSQAAMEGGAIACLQANPILDHCLIVANQGRYGGAICCVDSSQVQMTHCDILANTVLLRGGGIFCDINSQITIKNCLIGENTSSSPEPDQGPQIAAHGNSTVTVSYSDIDGGQDDILLSVSTLNWLDGNIDADPNFVSFDPAAAFETWDLHLQSEYGRWDPTAQNWLLDAVTSPCIDAADPLDSYELELWPHGKRANMGIFGNTAQASRNGNPADFNVDNQVDGGDFAELAEHWLGDPPGIYDLSGDGNVNTQDLSTFAENWLWTR